MYVNLQKSTYVYEVQFFLQIWTYDGMTSAFNKNLLSKQQAATTWRLNNMCVCV